MATRVLIVWCIVGCGSAADGAAEREVADATVDASGAREVEESVPERPEIAPRPATALGTDAVGINARIHPHGLATRWYLEYGPTAAYGARTAARDLGPRLAAHYAESWDDGLAGWRGGVGLELEHVAGGGAAGGFVRYREPNGTDYNHLDGIGMLHLVQYFYPGRFALDFPSASLGGGDPDFRDARVRVSLRGTDWRRRRWTSDPEGLTRDWSRGDELAFWAQADATEAGDMSQMSNWAHTDDWIGDALYAGTWTEVDYTLENDTSRWSYAGQDRNQRRDTYIYAPLDDVLGHLDVDFFHVLLFVDPYAATEATIDLDELAITYRNHSLLLPSNGGELLEAPAGEAGDPTTLTDGWRTGVDRAWRSGPAPVAPQTFVYGFARPVTITRVLVSNDRTWPSAEVELAVSRDRETWTPLASGAIPTGSPHGPMFDHALFDGLEAPASYLRVTVRGPAGAAYWGLGELEAFGSGARMATDDDWYHVSADVAGLVAGGALHYRVVAESDAGVSVGPDEVYVVPDGRAPDVRTGRATVIDGDHVRLEGVLNTFGGEVWWSFELGPEAGVYPHRTTPVRTGQEVTPRHVARTVELSHPELADLPRGGPVHYRMVVCAGCDDPVEEDRWTQGADATFVAP